MKTAVILFAYNRPEYLKRAIATHKRHNHLDYFAYIDLSPVQDEIYDIIKESGVYDHIIKRLKHRGLNDNLMTGINLVFNFLNYDAVIVLEDDLLISEDAINYLERKLIALESVPFVGSVSLYKGSTYDKTFKCWGWGTWKNRWNTVEWIIQEHLSNGEVWDVMLNAHFKRVKMKCSCSNIERVQHIGNKGQGYTCFDSLTEWLKKCYLRIRKP